MPQHAAKNRTPRPPGGRRASGAEVQRRLEHADRLLRDGRGRMEVLDSMKSTFGLSTRAADGYIRRVRERWAEESAGTREVERAAALARLERLSVKAEQRGAFSAAVSAEKLRAQISGLLAPVEVKVAAEPAPRLEMSLEEAVAELEALSEWLQPSIVRPALAAPADPVGTRRA